MAMTIKEISKAEVKKIPKGARISNKEVRYETEEIENGFLISKCVSIDYRYDDGERKDCYGSSYYTKKWYSKTNPLTIKVEGDKALADAFEAE